LLEKARQICRALPRIKDKIFTGCWAFAKLQTLSRLLRDDFKRSTDLCINLVSVFFSLSHFAQFHPLLIQVGLQRAVRACRQAAFLQGMHGSWQAASLCYAGTAAQGCKKK
jgi:hypothetical protein